MKNSKGEELTKDEEIAVLRRCIEELKTEILRLRERQMAAWIKKIKP
jgi:hypothetical protein